MKNHNPPLLIGAANEAQKRNATALRAHPKERHMNLEAEIFQAIRRWYERRQNGLRAMVLHADGSMS